MSEEIFPHFNNFSLCLFLSVEIPFVRLSYAYLYSGIPPVFLNHSTMATSDPKMGHCSETLLPSTAITSMICAVNETKQKEKTGLRKWLKVVGFLSFFLFVCKTFEQSFCCVVLFQVFFRFFVRKLRENSMRISTIFTHSTSARVEFDETKRAFLWSLITKSLRWVGMLENAFRFSLLFYEWLLFAVIGQMQFQVELSL